ncbi:MAG: Gfo/Idh/MocA family protein [Caldilineaceae bacterium]
MASNFSDAANPQRPPGGGRSYTPYALGPQSIGWLIVGASQQAAPRFVAALRRMPPLADGSVAANVVAIQSRSPFRGHTFATQQQIPFHSTELDDLLARPAVRAVYVANQPTHHADAVLAALRAGKHVLCEPPIAPTAEQAQFLHHSAADRGLVLAVNYQQRFDPALLALRATLAGHEVGDLLALHVHQLTPLPIAQRTWRLAPQAGGLLFERALRAIDVARFVCSDEVANVFALAGPAMYGAGVVDDLHALLTMRRNRAVVHLHDSWNCSHAQSRIEAYGTSGSATLVEWSSERTGRLFIDPSGPGARAAHADRDAGRPVAPLALPNVDLWLLSLLAVHDAIRTGNPPSPSAIDDITALDVAHALQSSLRTGATARPLLTSAPT